MTLDDVAFLSTDDLGLRYSPYISFRIFFVIRLTVKVKLCFLETDSPVVIFYFGFGLGFIPSSMQARCDSRAFYVLDEQVVIFMSTSQVPFGQRDPNVVL